MNMGKVVKFAKGFFLSLVFLSVIFFGLQKAWEAIKNNDLFFLGSISGNNEIDQSAEKNAGSKPQKPYRNWEVPELLLTAESAIAVESKIQGDDKILYKKNSYLRLPIASLTKLMTAVVSIENYDLSQKVIISKNATSQEGEQGALKAGAEITMNDLIYIMLIESSNQAAYALSEGMDKFDFVRLMNNKARELKMESTFFTEPTGLLPENVSTSEDLVKLSKYILNKHPEIAEISRLKEYDLPNYGKLENTDQLLGELPAVVASKTGFTVEAGGCLMLLLNNSEADSYLIYIVLGTPDRFSEMKKMIEWINTAYVW